MACPSQMTDTIILHNIELSLNHPVFNGIVTSSECAASSVTVTVNLI
jgi:hypothetical protein